MAYCNFENPIYKAEDEGEEDCEVPGELARLLQQKEKDHSAPWRADLNS